METGNARMPIGLRWHLLWFLPVSALVLAVVERHMVVFGYTILELAYHRWTWGVLISPSGAFCFGVVAASVTLPLQGLFAVVLLVTSPDLSIGRRWFYSMLIIVGLFFIGIVTDALIWGSFPFIFDDQGVSRLRMIPFFPWPAGRYLEL